MRVRDKLVYICSPLAGDMESNMEKARYYCRLALSEDPTAIPIAPHIYFTQFTDDTNPKERAIDMDMGLTLLSMCKEIWVYGYDNPSEGMKTEIQYAQAHGVKIIKKPRVTRLNDTARPKPTLDKERVKFWHDSYLTLNQTCPEMFGDGDLLRKLADLQKQEHEFDTKPDDERTDYYACIAGLQSVIKEKNLQFD